MQNKIGLIGKKMGITQIFDADGNVVPVTVVKILPATIVQVKTSEKDGYNALKLGFEEIEEKKLNRPMLNTFKKNNLKCFNILKEFRLDSVEGYKVGDLIAVDQFAEGDFIDVTGISKAKGFQGVIKLYGFAGGPKTRGQSDRWRSPGSIGSGTTPGHVWKNMRMNKRMGGDQITVQSLKVVSVDKEKEIMLIKGSVPGVKDSVVVIKSSLKKGSVKK